MNIRANLENKSAPEELIADEEWRQGTEISKAQVAEAGRK
jgi:hypothetical protein